MGQRPNGKPPPLRAEPAAERALLGCVFIENALATNLPPPEHFFDPRHREVCLAMHALVGAGLAIDPVTVDAQFGDRSVAVGGVPFLSDLVCANFDRANFASYVDLVNEAARERRLKLAASELLYSTLPVERLERRAAELFGNRVDDRHGPQARRVVDLVENILAEAALPVVSTGIDALDTALDGGLGARMMHVLVAATGRGKTSLAVQIAARHAEHSPALYYSGELTPAQLAARILAQRTGRSWREVIRGRLGAEEMREILAPLEVDVLGRCVNPVAAITHAVDEMIARNHGVPLVVVDYLQLLADIGPDMRLATMASVRGLLALVESREVAVLALSQGSRSSARTMREGDGRAEEFVDMGAESSELEKAAATVMALVYQAEDGATEHDVTLMLAKQRLGGACKVGLRFHGPSGCWEGLETAPPAPAERREAEIERKVLEAVRGTTMALTRTELKGGRVPGYRGDSVRQAIERLITAGRLITSFEQRPNSVGRMRAIEVLGLPTETVPEPGTVSDRAGPPADVGGSE